jgi:hypothetical protein
LVPPALQTVLAAQFTAAIHHAQYFIRCKRGRVFQFWLAAFDPSSAQKTALSFFVRRGVKAAMRSFQAVGGIELSRIMS